MTAIERHKTLVEIEESTSEGRREMAAARAEARIVSLLRKAFRLSGMRQQELAHQLGVSEGRVSQVLGGDSPLRITTVARYLRALGYDLAISANPADPGAPVLDRPRKPRAGAATAEIHQHHREKIMILTEGKSLSDLKGADFHHTGTASGLSGVLSRTHVEWSPLPDVTQSVTPQAAQE